MTDGCTNAQTHSTEHSNPQTPDTAPRTSGRPRDTRARTQVRSRATRTPLTGTRARPSAAGWEKVAALTRHVYLLICINERLYLTPPAPGGRGRRICPRRGTLNETSIRVPPTLRGVEGDYKVRGSLGVREERLQHRRPGTRTGRGEHRGLVG